MDRDNNSNIQQGRPVPVEMVVASEEKIKLEIKKNKITRMLYVIGGTLSLALAILGIVVPGLPVTPLALLSAFLYAKSSKRLYHWLLNNKLLGPRIKSYQKRNGVTRKGKIGIIAFMTIMVLFSSFIVIQNLPIRMAILSLGLIGLVVVWFFVPTAQPDIVANPEKEKEDLSA
ncbi:MAG: YbaN family protein [Porphyromonadaceae bacterium]|nr:YbaN family protein [Porphyromonadaceae bacterium]